jgi:hypothetical protein
MVYCEWIQRSRLRYTVLLCMSVLVSACGTSVNVDYDPSTDFSTIRTFKLEPQPTRVSDDPRIDSPLMQQRVVKAIGDKLKEKGLRETSPADVRVTYRIDVKQEIESSSSGVSVGVGTYSRNVGVGFGYGFPASDVESYDWATLTIDLQRPNGELLWRGSDRRRLYSGSTPEKNNRQVNDLVDDILEKFPPQ